MNSLIRKEDINFLLYDFLKIENELLQDSENYHSRDTFDAVIETAEKIAQKYFAPHNAKADSMEPQFISENQSNNNKDYVTIIPEVKTAIDHFSDAGFIAARHSENLGGMELPAVIMAACQSYFFAANPSTSAYPFLTTAAANIIEKFANEEHKKLYLEKMLTGKYFGTMALTEPDVGSSLGDLTTYAVPIEGKNSYLIKGQKMFISGGDHQLSENIIHLVLARVKGAPAGVKGISLFLVPKFLIDANHNIIKDNDVKLAGLLHKMGYRGTTSTVLNFGENDQCHGFLIGQENQGLKTMFAMMNEARIGVGLGAAAIGYRGYLCSLEYAKQRKQGRQITNQDPNSDQVYLIEHADVKRMLLQQKSYVEGSLALCLYAAWLVDLSENTANETEALESAQLLDLLTPVVKSFPSKYATKANDIAIQILGGSGYTRDYPVEQCYRDNRLNPIHEGTEGIQALDLLGRKLWQQNSSGVKILNKKITLTISQTQQIDELKSLSIQLEKYLSKIMLTLEHFIQFQKNQQFDITLGNATLFLDAFSIFIVSWQWLLQAQAALNKEQNDFFEGKLNCAKYYLFWELPKIDPLLNIVNQNDSTCMSTTAEFL